ncbi:MAG: prepilin-type N-terminal cleavage/methylation domain-containing protein [Holophagaceae bacterium]|nr:prepilin-type N-terminal cleavage/methylation domain-containing protein [Holophagaceae bacterium]
MEIVRKNRQKGFSLMELMIAMTIIGILAVIGMKFFGNQADEARRLQAYDTMSTLNKGLTEFYMKTGNYPELGSWEAMVAANSPLVTRHMIPPNMSVNDPWGTPYEGKSTRSTFELKCAGRPEKGDDLGPITMTPNGTIGAPGQTTQNDNTVAAPAGVDSAPAASPQ